MIFVTVGTQLGFDRLVNAVDAWAAANPQHQVYAQIGPSQAPKAIPYSAFLAPAEADEKMQQANLIVAHAGMGSILTALRLGKPILVLPRRHAQGEHRNDHQMATAKWLSNRPGITVAWDERELMAKLDDPAVFAPAPTLAAQASGPLIDRLAAYLNPAHRS
ncbi:MAG: glycosyl transferase family 28 [Burkholderiales bacterium]|nr:glycosyl transferase family 28 [Burkholderiales bacterium]